jgi:hypothetical protein
MVNEQGYFKDGTVNGPISIGDSTMRKKRTVDVNPWDKLMLGKKIKKRLLLRGLTL